MHREYKLYCCTDNSSFFFVSWNKVGPLWVNIRVRRCLYSLWTVVCLFVLFCLSGFVRGGQQDQPGQGWPCGPRQRTIKESNILLHRYYFYISFSPAIMLFIHLCVSWSLNIHIWRFVWTWSPLWDGTKNCPNKQNEVQKPAKIVNTLFTHSHQCEKDGKRFFLHRIQYLNFKLKLVFYDVLFLLQWRLYLMSSVRTEPWILTHFTR